MSEVLVAGHHVCGEPLLFGKQRQGANHIVGFVAGHLEHGNVISLGNALDVWHRLAYVLGRLFASSLVFGVHLVAERAALGVEADGDVAWVLALQQVLQRVHKSENGRSVQPLRCVSWVAYECIIGTEYECVGVE